MNIVSNVSSTHGEVFADIAVGAEELFIVSPFLTNDFDSLLGNIDLKLLER